MPYQAIIFDLDGTLIDSERVWFATFTEMCARFGKEYTPQHHALMMGKSRDANLATFQNVVGVPITVEHLQAAREQVQHKLFNQGALGTKSGVQSFLSALAHAGYKMGVATASGPEYRGRVLSMTGIDRYFSEFVSGEEVAHPKPAPDVFLAVAKKLGVDPSKCLAVEDGIAGVESGLAAGMDVLGIRDLKFLRDLPGAKRVIDSFDEITVSQIEAMSDLT